MLTVLANVSTPTWAAQLATVDNQSACQTIQQLANNDSKLTKVYLHGDKIGDRDGAKALAGALAQNRCLTRLWLNFCRLGDSGAEALASALTQNGCLTKLYLPFNRIGYRGAEALANALTQNGCLTKLNLHRNEIGDGGAYTLADALAQNRCLTSLDLRMNEISDTGAQALACALAQNRYLTSLRLDRNQIDDSGAQRAIDAALECNREARQQVVEVAYTRFLESAKRRNKELGRAPCCFISYAWNSANPAAFSCQQAFQKRLQADLQKLGASVFLDTSHLVNDLNAYMAQIAQCDRILLIGTPRLRNRAEEATPNNLQIELGYIRERLRRQPDCLVLLHYEGGYASAVFPFDMEERHGWYDFRQADKYALRMARADQRNSGAGKHSGLIPRLFGSPYDNAYCEDVKDFEQALKVAKPAVPPFKANRAFFAGQEFHQFLVENQKLFTKLCQARNTPPPICYLSCSTDETPAVLGRIDQLQRDLSALGLTVWREDQERTAGQQANRAQFVLEIGTPRWPTSPAAHASRQIPVRSRLPLLVEGETSTVFAADWKQLLARDFTKPDNYYRDMARQDNPCGLIPVLYGIPHADKQTYGEFDKAYAHLHARLELRLKGIFG